MRSMFERNAVHDSFLHTGYMCYPYISEIMYGKKRFA